MVLVFINSWLYEWKNTVMNKLCMNILLKHNPHLEACVLEGMKIMFVSVVV
jgi:hypothetical protein